MRYQRVLYAKKLTNEIKAKMRIVSYTKLRSKKNNVFFVKFASYIDMKNAERIAKEIGGITVKPIQPLWCAKKADCQEEESLSEVSSLSSASTWSISPRSTSGRSISLSCSTSPSAASSLSSTSRSTISLLSSSGPETISLLSSASPSTISLLSSNGPETISLLSSASPSTISLLSSSGPETISLSSETTPSTNSLLSTPMYLNCLSPLSTMSFLSDNEYPVKQLEHDKLQDYEESLEERVERLLGNHPEVIRIKTSKCNRQPAKSPNFNDGLEHNKNSITEYEAEKKQLLINVQSCLKMMEIARKAADRFFECYKCGMDCEEILNYFFTTYSTAFYIKSTVSRQIKTAFDAGLRVWWVDVCQFINEFDNDVRYQQKFMAEASSLKHLTSKMDGTTSIAMTSKLAYQLSKLSI